jgi:acetyl esterase/lipase
VRTNRAFLAISLLTSVGFIGLPAAHAVARHSPRASSARREALTIDPITVIYASPDGVDLKLDVYIPPGQLTVPAVILIHGGGYKKGDRTGWAVEAERLASEDDLVAVSVDYRLLPQFIFPAQLQDMQSVVRFLRANAAEFHLDPTRIGALGASAGGHLALLLATTGSGGHTSGSRVAVAASWSGATRLGQLHIETSLELIGCSVADCPVRWKLASPYYQIDPSDPPLYMAISTNEIVPSSQATDMEAKCQSLGVPVQVHLVPGSRHAREYEDVVWDESVSFLEAFL